MCSKDKIILNTILILPTVGLEIKFMFTLQPRCSMLLCIKSVRKSDFLPLNSYWMTAAVLLSLPLPLQPFCFPIEKVFGSMPTSHSLNFNTAWAGSLLFKHHTDRIRGFLPPQFSSTAPQPFPFQAQREIQVFHVTLEPFPSLPVRCFPYIHTADLVWKFPWIPATTLKSE